MVNSKPVSVSKLDPTGPVWVIVSKSVATLKNIPTKQKLSVANNSSGSYSIIAVATYYHAAKRGFECGYECGYEVRTGLGRIKSEIDNDARSGGF